MEGQYDLAFAALSPAVRSSNDLMAMEKASRSRCCYITACPSDWMGLRNELWEKVVGGFVSGDASSVRYPLNILLESRRSPELFRVRAETETHNPVQAVVDHYVNYFGIFTEMTPQKVEIVRDHITSRSHAPRIVIAAGARSRIPLIPGLEKVPYRTSEDIFDITTLPKSIIMLGGGYKSCEFAHFFSAMGVRVSIIQHNLRLVPDEEPEISFVVKKKLGEHVAVSTNQVVKEVRSSNGGVEVVREDRGTGAVVSEEAEMLLLGTGMQSNAGLLNVKATGVETDAFGYVTVDQHLQTTAPGIWAFGDITGRHMFRHTANYESQVVWYNMNNAERAVTDEHAIPHAVYTYPTVGSVGATEDQVKTAGIKYLAGYSRYANVAKGSAMLLAAEAGEVVALLSPPAEASPGEAVNSGMTPGEKQIEFKDFQKLTLKVGTVVGKDKVDIGREITCRCPDVPEGTRVAVFLPSPDAKEGLVFFTQNGLPVTADHRLPSGATIR